MLVVDIKFIEKRKDGTVTREDKRSKLLAFFRDKETKKQKFTYAEAAISVGYKANSISKFVSEHLMHILADHEHPFWSMVNTDSGAS